MVSKERVNDLLHYSISFCPEDIIIITGIEDIKFINIFITYFYSTGR